MSGVLLDSHVLLWLLADDARLGDEARRLIRESSAVDVCAATVWELELKRARRKLTMPEDLSAVLRAAGLQELPVTWGHAAAYAQAGLAHRDPFDRILVGQATQENLTFLTADRLILETGLQGVVDARK